MSGTDYNIKWVVGVVENVDDPQKGGLVQVRLNGVHESNSTLLPTKFLPWARVFTTATSSGSDSGSGASPTGIEVGSHFFGISMDSQYENLAVLFTWFGSDEKGWSQVHPLAKGEPSELSKKISDSILSGMSFSASNSLDEPLINRATTYPNNDVNASRSGLESEIDNSNSKVRKTVSHPSGAYTNLDPEGNETRKISQKLKIIGGLCLDYITGSKFVSVIGDCVKVAKGDIYSKTDGQETKVNRDLLLKSSGSIEIDVGELRIKDIVRVGGTLYVPNIRVGNLQADNISCAGIIDGIAKFSSEAVKAASVSPPVIPAPGAGAGDTSVTFSLEDNGGDYPFEFKLDTTKKPQE